MFSGRLTSAEADVINNSEYGNQVVEELSADSANTIWKNTIKSNNGNNLNSITDVNGALGVDANADGGISKVADGDKGNKLVHSKGNANQTADLQVSEKHDLLYDTQTASVDNASELNVANSAGQLEKSEKSGIIKEMEYSPRRMIKGNCSVDWSKVHSSEYRKRLSFISDNDKVVDSINTRAKWALNNREGVKTEELYAINLDDGTEIAKIIDQHFESSVKRTTEFTRKLNDADSKGNNVLLIHNHPQGLPPSISDINALFDNKNVSGLTIGHDGSLYYYTKPKIKIPEFDYNVRLRHYKEYDEVTNIEKALEDLQKQFGFTFKKL